MRVCRIFRVFLYQTAHRLVTVVSRTHQEIGKQKPCLYPPDHPAPEVPSLRMSDARHMAGTTVRFPAPCIGGAGDASKQF